MEKDKDYSLVTVGFFGAVAGALTALVVNSMMDKRAKSKIGETLFNLRSQILKTLKDLSKLSEDSKPKVVS